jgi:hypothetical protein
MKQGPDGVDQLSMNARARQAGQRDYLRRRSV